EFLFELGDLLKMTIDIEPLVEKVDSRKHQGFYAYVHWVESGCHIYIWDKFRFLTVDIYTCKEFSAEDAINLTKDFFKCSEVSNLSFYFSNNDNLESKPSDKYVFIQCKNYALTGKDSIWGPEDPNVLEVLEKEEIKGKWLNLAAGDGRYNLGLLKKADEVLVTDIDKNALEKLRKNTPEEYLSKLKIKVFNIIEEFPFEDRSFDGILCTYTLHLFPREIFRKIFSEIDRIIKPDGKIVIDFMTDIKRTKLNGEAYILSGAPHYAQEEAEELLKEVFSNYFVKIRRSSNSKNFEKTDPPFRATFKGVLLVAKK
ncbi:MAG: methyltransferase domain-containing protein, partial [Candidatus Woesearchaeota archaeon]